MRLPRPRTARDWRRVRRTVVSLAATGLILVVLGYVSVGFLFVGAALVCLVILESALLRELTLRGQQQQYALTQVRPLFGDLPPDLGGWAADPILVYNAVRLIIEARPRMVLECGSGSSTVAIARCLRALGGRIVTLEHDPEYASRTTEMLRRHGVGDLATVVIAPLSVRDADGKTTWYGPEFESHLSEPIDVLVVDGPPKATGPRARYPAIPVLKSRLAPECWILMDDGDRVDERAIAQAWSKELGAELTYLEGGRGGWLLHRRPGALADAEGSG